MGVEGKKPFVITLEANSNKHQPLLGGKPQTEGMHSGRIFRLPGQEGSKHSTETYEELLIFLSGQGEVIIENDTPLQVGIGKVCYIPPQTIHNVRNTGDKPLVYIYCVAPTKH